MSPTQDDGVSGQSRYEAGRFGLLEQIHVATIRLDTKVDNLGLEIRHLRDEHKDDHADHETRIRTLESKPTVSPATVWKVVGVVLTITSILVTVVTAIIKNG